MTPFLTASGSLAKPPTDGMPGGFSSLSANKTMNGIVWTSMPNGDGQWNPVPGRIVAFDATTLKQLWSDNDNVTFAKSVPPTIADGKVIRATAANQVIVYGLLRRAGKAGLLPRGAGMRQLCYSIEQKYANYAGSSALLGVPTSPVAKIEDDPLGGMYRTFRASIFGMSHTISSRHQHADAGIPTCSQPVGQSTPIESAIYWNRRVCAHVLQADILKLWLQLGGTRSKLGYPIDDETITPDHHGRMSLFEHGEIWWYPKKGAYVHKREERDMQTEQKPEHESSARTAADQAK